MSHSFIGLTYFSNCMVMSQPDEHLPEVNGNAASEGNSK